MRKYTAAFMTGIGFTFGMLFGLLIQLPVTTLPASSLEHGDAHLRVRRNLEHLQINSERFLAVAAAENGNGYNDIPALTGDTPMSKGNPAIKSDYASIPSVDPVHNSMRLLSLGKSRLLNKDKQMQGNVHGVLSAQPGVAFGHDIPLRNGVSEGQETHNNNVGIESVPPGYQTQSQGDSRQNHKQPAPVSVSVTVNIVVNAERKSGLLKSSESHLSEGRLNDNKLISDGLPAVIVSSARQSDNASGLDSRNNSRTTRLNAVNGIFWSKHLENSCPSTGFIQSEHDAWKRKVASSRFVKMQEGCGRMQNRLLTFRDASTACARYRLNNDQIQGEIYSYYLSKLLHINNLPPTTLQLVKSTDDQWRTVHLDIANAQWADDRVVILTKWIDNLIPAFIPVEMREDDRKLHPEVGISGQKSTSELCELLQWSDLLVFDYLTANLDRVVNNMFNRQWNEQMMNSPAHNLEKSTENGNLLFIDNESGLFHGYRLLDKYAPFHHSLLGSLCVFRNSTASAVERLHKSGNIGEELHTLFAESEPLHRHVPKMQKKNMKVLQQRIADVYDQINRCKVQYES